MTHSELEQRERELRVRAVAEQLRGCRVRGECPHCEQLIGQLLELTRED